MDAMYSITKIQSLKVSPSCANMKSPGLSSVSKVVVKGQDAPMYAGSPLLVRLRDALPARLEPDVSSSQCYQSSLSTCRDIL